MYRVLFSLWYGYSGTIFMSLIAKEHPKLTSGLFIRLLGYDLAFKINYTYLAC